MDRVVAVLHQHEVVCHLQIENGQGGAGSRDCKQLSLIKYILVRTIKLDPHGLSVALNKRYCALKQALSGRRHSNGLCR